MRFITGIITALAAFEVVYAGSRIPTGHNGPTDEISSGDDDYSSGNNGSVKLVEPEASPAVPLTTKQDINGWVKEAMAEANDIQKNAEMEAHRQELEEKEEAERLAREAEEAEEAEEREYQERKAAEITAEDAVKAEKAAKERKEKTRLEKARKAKEEADAKAHERQEKDITGWVHKAIAEARANEQAMERKLREEKEREDREFLERVEREAAEAARQEREYEERQEREFQWQLERQEKELKNRKNREREEREERREREREERELEEDNRKARDDDKGRDDDRRVDFNYGYHNDFHPGVNHFATYPQAIPAPQPAPAMYAPQPAPVIAAPQVVPQVAPMMPAHQLGQAQAVPQVNDFQINDAPIDLQRLALPHVSNIPVDLQRFATPFGYPVGNLRRDLNADEDDDNVSETKTEQKTTLSKTAKPTYASKPVHKKISFKDVEAKPATTPAEAIETKIKSSVPTKNVKYLPIKTLETRNVSPTPAALVTGDDLKVTIKQTHKQLNKVKDEVDRLLRVQKIAEKHTRPAYADPADARQVIKNGQALSKYEEAMDKIISATRRLDDADLH